MVKELTSDSIISSQLCW